MFKQYWTLQGWRQVQIPRETPMVQLERGGASDLSKQASLGAIIVPDVQCIPGRLRGGWRPVHLNKSDTSWCMYLRPAGIIDARCKNREVAWLSIPCPSVLFIVALSRRVVTSLAVVIQLKASKFSSSLRECLLELDNHFITVRHSYPFLKIPTRVSNVAA